MTYAYKRADLSNVRAGDKVLLRNGKIQTVSIMRGDETFVINDLNYSVSGECFSIPRKDAIWVVGANKGSIDLQDYPQEEGIYALREDGVVLVSTCVDDSDPAVPLQFKPVDEDDLSNAFWYYRDGTRYTRIEPNSRIVQVLAPKQNSAGVGSTDTFFKDITSSLLSEFPSDRLLSIPSVTVLAIIKKAHSGVEPNKVSSVFVSLLEGFSRENTDIKLSVKALRDLLSL
jgi:hypothetical protein